MKRITVILTVLIIGLLLVGCGVPPAVQTELEKLRQEKATWQKDQTELGQLRTKEESWQKDQEELKELRKQEKTWIEDQAELGQLRTKEESWQKDQEELKELKGENQELKKAIESLREPLPLPQEEVVTTIVRGRLRVLLRNYYPNSAIHLGASEVPLVSRQFVEEFLAADRTDFLPGCMEVSKDFCDFLAFRLKDRWVRAGYPPYALGLLKGERPCPGGLHWRNVFIVMEGEKLVIYEIIPKYDRLVKIEKPNLNTYRVIFSNYDPI